MGCSKSIFLSINALISFSKLTGVVDKQTVSVANLVTDRKPQTKRPIEYHSREYLTTDRLRYANNIRVEQRTFISKQRVCLYIYIRTTGMSAYLCQNRGYVCTSSSCVIIINANMHTHMHFVTLLHLVNLHAHETIYF